MGQRGSGTGTSPTQFRGEGPRAGRGRPSPKGSRQDTNPRSHPQASGPPPGPSVFPSASWALAAPPRLKQPRPSGQTPGSRRGAHSGGRTHRSTQPALHTVLHLELASRRVPSVRRGGTSQTGGPLERESLPEQRPHNKTPVRGGALAENPSHPPPLCPGATATSTSGRRPEPRSWLPTPHPGAAHGQPGGRGEPSSREGPV